MQRSGFAGVFLGAALACLGLWASEAGAAELKVFGSRVTKVIAGKFTEAKPAVVILALIFGLKFAITG